MTTEQFEWVTIVTGMMLEGCSKTEALGYIEIMGAPASMVLWVKENV